MARKPKHVQGFPKIIDIPYSHAVPHGWFKNIYQWLRNHRGGDKFSLHLLTKGNGGSKMTKILIA